MTAKSPAIVQTAITSAPTGHRLQRQCACGNHTVGGGECAECAKKKNRLQRKASQPSLLGGTSPVPRLPMIQRKLTVGASNDPLEQEADRVADRVLAAPSHSAVNGIPLRIQRYTGQTSAGMEIAPASVDRVLASSGSPLEPALRQDMEQRFGYDFSRVRVHSGVAAEQSAQEANAYAYTVGHNIVFSTKQYAPHTEAGRWLVAHELTHVLQQREGSLALQRAEVDDNPTFCFPDDGSPALLDVGSVLNDWIADAQARGGQNSQEVPTAIFNELGQLGDRLTTIAEQRIADLPKGQVRHVSYEESRYRVPEYVLEFYRRHRKSPVAPVINLCGVCVGSDKIGHFFQQGGEYFFIGEALRQRIQTWTPEERQSFLDRIDGGLGSVLPPTEQEEDRIIKLYTDEYGKWLEGFPNRLSDEEITWLRSNMLISEEYSFGHYGRKSSGVLSRGDLEANLQGGRFYRDAMRRPGMRLDICHYVNDGWNEYLNPSSYGGPSLGRFDPKFGPQLPVDRPALFPGRGISATIPFDTASTDPNDAAMQELKIKLVSYRDSLSRGEYRLTFVGHASRTGDDSFNQTLSEQRAQTVKGQLEFLIREALGNLDFEFDDDQSPAVGHGEERARKEGKPENDNSQSDRVVEVVFKVVQVQ